MRVACPRAMLYPNAMSSSAVQHRASIDLARFGAAFGVVWAHAFVSPQDWVGHLALALFLILTAFLAIGSMQRAGGRFSWVKRAQRIALPWLFWSLMYRLLDMAISDDPARFVPLRDPWSLLIGSTIHLWFLPFVMLASALVPLIGNRVAGPRDLWLASGVLVAVSLPILWLHGAVAMPGPLPQWAFALPAFAYGILAAFGHRFGLVWLPLAAMALISGLTYAWAGQLWALQLGFAALLFEAAWRLDLRARWLPALGQAAFGIYLLHPFFMLVCYKIFGPQVSPALAALVCFALSWAATVLLLRLPGLRRMV
ncbi:acyltransferase 3 [Rhodobacter ferrooxidans]|uniref:Acyltransferase 3 n=2 Tax=Rhodobacter ferrooxidans TaxID=371731 RepID=C8RXJ0_9RHOB|nr:acyltransferase 3 [Rhodobacter sp. SW2]